jgi:hypothetical protein
MMTKTLLGFAFVLATTGTAVAEGDAAALEASGNKHFQLAEYDAAIADFKEAFRISSEPGYLYNIAQAYRLKKDCRSSATFYKNYLRAKPDAPNAAKVRERISEMEACAATQPPEPVNPTTTNPTTTNPTNPTTPTTTPPAQPEQPPVQPPEPPPEQPSGGGGRGWMTYTGIGGMAVGAIGLGLGVKFMLDGKSANSDLKEKCMTSCTSAEALAIEDDGKAANKKAVIFSVAGGVFLVGGVVLFVLSRGGGGESEPAPAVSLTNHGATVSYGWSF